MKRQSQKPRWSILASKRLLRAGRRWCGALLAATLLLFAAGAAAQDVAVPPLTQRVTDLTATLSAPQQAAMEARLAQFEQQKGSQIAVLLVPTTQPETIEQYAMRVAEQWRLGREKVDDGLLLLVAKEDRSVRIEVGYGLEGVIPDAVARRVIDEYMTPAFRQGDFDGGLNAAIDRLTGLIEGEPLPPPKARNGQLDNMLPLLLFGGIAVCMLLRAIFGQFLGGTLGGGAVGLAAWLLGGSLTIAVILGFIAFFMTLTGSAGGFGQVGGSGRGYGGGGFSGGGGGFGGGGASGRW